MGYLLDSVKRTDVIKGVDTRRQPSVQAEDLVVDKSGEGKVVEEIGKVFPDIGVAIFSEAFIIEPVDLCDLSRLVVSTENCDSRRISDLQSDKEGHGFDGVVTTVYIVSCLSLTSIPLLCCVSFSLPIKR